MYSVFLLIGSNEGDRQGLLYQAKREIVDFIGTIKKTSQIYETDAWGKTGLPKHLNQAIQINTPLEPLTLLVKLQQIETNLGRERNEKWGCRKIDIDIIYFEDFIIRRPQLVIPHPLMHQRRFVLVPLTEIAPHFLHPILQKENHQLLAELDDPLHVEIFDVVSTQ